MYFIQEEEEEEEEQVEFTEDEEAIVSYLKEDEALTSDVLDKIIPDWWQKEPFKYDLKLHVTVQNMQSITATCRYKSIC